MNPISFIQRQKELLPLFRSGKDVFLKDTFLGIRYYNFKSDCNIPSLVSIGLPFCDRSIPENRNFTYPIFFFNGRKKASQVIILLHGLNERSWDKYLCWAEYLATNTGKAVLLFPIAYHINRAPKQWSDPRSMSVLVKKRQDELGEDPLLCFANAALSERLFENPVRFYTSGRQTVQDLTNLVCQIKRGDHPLFAPDTQVDLFAYSIGAFLSEITLMANPEKLFDASRLFIFCGGSLFRYMFGESRFIMDKPAYDRLLDFYCKDWLSDDRLNKYNEQEKADDVLSAFNAMIVPDIQRQKREGFFSSLGSRLSGISLKKDMVMPYSGVEACMGSENADKQITLTDFPYVYTHEAPFPSNGKIDQSLLTNSFVEIFSKAANFLC
jgi:hypothetical protein